MLPVFLFVSFSRRRKCVHNVKGALLEVEVGTKAEWSNPDHPLK
jgi:hypothetical protein